MNQSTNRMLVAAGVALLITAGCSSTNDSPSASNETPAAIDGGSESAPGIRIVSAKDGAAVADNPPEDLVILDVRTQEEFDEGHLEGAIMIDFYRDDFAEELAKLDPNVPYLLYCRSGNRSGQTTAIMQTLGFSDVSDIDGGILAWNQAGLATVAE